MVHLNWLDYGVMAVILMLAGLAAGFVGAFFGVGGGTIMVPCFLVIYSRLDANAAISMHQAIAASLVLVVANTYSASRKHYRAGNLALDYFRGWAVWILLGAIIGGLLMAFVSALSLKILFTAYLALAAIYQMVKKPVENSLFTTAQLPQGWVKATAALVIGALSLLLGIAGGPFTTPFLTYFNYPLRKAMAIAVASGVIIGVVGSVAAIIVGWGEPRRLPISLGYVNLMSVAFVTPFVIVSSPWGVQAANRIPERLLHRLYILFLLALMAYMLYNLIA